MTKECHSQESEKRVGLHFLDEQVTDLDELSNPRSPGLVLFNNIPRRDFSFSETELDLISTEDKAQRSDSQFHPTLSAETKLVSRSTHTLPNFKRNSVKRGHEHIEDDDPGIRSKEALKETFISRYTLEFQGKDDNVSGQIPQNSPASSTSNLSGIGSHCGAPRRQSYTLAVSSDEEGSTLVRDVLSSTAIHPSSIYDVPMNSGGFRVDDFEAQEKNKEDLNTDVEIANIFSPEEILFDQEGYLMEKEKSLNPSCQEIKEKVETRENMTENYDSASQNCKSTMETNKEQDSSFGAYFWMLVFTELNSDLDNNPVNSLSLSFFLLSF